MEKATFDQAQHLLLLAGQADLDREEWQTFFGSGVLADIFEAVKSGKQIDREAVRKVLVLEPLLPVFSVVVDYSRSLTEMVAAGKYDRVNSDITAEHFPVQGEGRQELEVALFHFNRYIGSDAAIEEMGKVSFQPAALPELLALGENQPELQRQYPIVALRSVWRDRGGDRYVPYLWCLGTERYLYLYLFVHDWAPLYRFAAVRKSVLGSLGR